MALTDKQHEALKKVSEEISALSDEEFWRKFEEHKDGDIARILIESGAILNLKPLKDSSDT